MIVVVVVIDCFPVDERRFGLLLLWGWIIHDGDTTGKVIRLVGHRALDFHLYHMDASQNDPGPDSDGHTGHARVNERFQLTLSGQGEGHDGVLGSTVTKGRHGKAVDFDGNVQHEHSTDDTFGILVHDVFVLFLNEALTLLLLPVFRRLWVIRIGQVSLLHVPFQMIACRFLYRRGDTLLDHVVSINVTGPGQPLVVSVRGVGRLWWLLLLWLQRYQLFRQRWGVIVEFFQ